MGTFAHILVINTDAAIRDFVSMALTDEGYIVTVATNGKAAHALLETRRPDLIILDLNSPTQANIDFLKRSQSLIPPIPIIGLGTSPSIEQWAQTRGITDFMLEPFDLDDMFKRVRRHL